MYYIKGRLVHRKTDREIGTLEANFAPFSTAVSFLAEVHLTTFQVALFQP